MSLFDVIKYPISNIPTIDQLRVVPINIFNKWIVITPWDGYSLNYDLHSAAEVIHRWYKDLSDPEAICMRDREIGSLRKLIRENEDEPI